MIGRITQLTVALAFLASIAFSAAPASAHSFDDDQVSASTAGALVFGTVHWWNLSSGSASPLTVRDMSADGHCARAYVRFFYANGYVEPWSFLGEACGDGQSKTATLPFNPGKRIAKIEFKAYRTGVGNSAIWAVSPGGA